MSYRWVCCAVIAYIGNRRNVSGWNIVYTLNCKIRWSSSCWICIIDKCNGYNYVDDVSTIVSNMVSSYHYVRADIDAGEITYVNQDWIECAVICLIRNYWYI